MKIEVEEYVRTKNGLIGKVNKIESAGSGVRFGGEFLTDTIIQFNDGKVYERRVRDKDIVNHSKNIIDLVESGDYVNGYPVRRIINFNNELCNFDLNTMKWAPLRNIDVYYNILTKEQYMQNCYKIDTNQQT